MTTVQLKLPKDVERRLVAEVQAGKHSSLEEVILEKLSHKDDPDLLRLTALTKDQIRRDLDDAWNNRGHAVDGEAVFSNIAAKSASHKAQSR